MEKIDKNNYEAYFLDYMEGTLSAEEKHDLFMFLEKHPSLKSEMEEDFGEVMLDPSPVVFNHKDELKIDENQLILAKNTVDDYIVASVEGQLTEAHQTQLDAYVKANGLEETVAYYKATILKPDTDIVFEDKERLKIKTGLVIRMPFIAKVASIAAVGLILITVGMNWKGEVSTVNGVSDRSEVFAGLAGHGVLPKHTKVSIPDDIQTIDNYNTSVNHSNVASNNANQAEIENRPEEGIIEQSPLFAYDDEIDTMRSLSPNQDNEAPRFVEEDGGIDNLVSNPNNDGSNPLEIYSEENDVAMATVKSEQPYKILTDAASNVINKDITFSRDKDLDSKEYVAYSFKLGKFEFERKKGR